MPTYEYHCKTCGYKFERFQSIADRSLTKCPKCGGLIERLISGGGGILFRGTGFYETDYRSESYKRAAKKEASESSSALSNSKSSGVTGSKSSQSSRTKSP